MKFKKINEEKEQVVKKPFEDAVEQSEKSKENMEAVMKDRMPEDVAKTSDIDDAIKDSKAEVAKPKFDVVESYLKDNNFKYLSNGSSIRAHANNRAELATIVEQLKSLGIRCSIHKSVNEGHSYNVVINDSNLLNESCIKEEVSDEAYDVAERIIDDIGDKKSITIDEFNEFFEKECKNVLGIDELNDKIEINGKSFDMQDFETDVRGILGYSGYNTEFEGENEGGLTMEALKETFKEGCDKIEEKKESTAEELGLPKDVEINKEKDLGGIDDGKDLDEIIGNYLSDTYGYCHFGFKFDDNGDTIKVHDIEWDTSESLKKDIKEGINYLEKGKGTPETLYKVVKEYYGDLMDLNARMADAINDGKEFVLDDQDYLALGAVLDAFDGDPFDDLDESKESFIYVVHSDEDENNIMQEFDNKRDAISYAKRNKVDKTFVDKVSVVDGEPNYNDVETIWTYADESLKESSDESSSDEDVVAKDKDEKPSLEESVKIISDLSDYKPWSGAVDLWDEIVNEDKVDELDFMLEDTYPDGITMTELNDLLWFEGDFVREQLGLVDVDTDEDFEEGLKNKINGLHTIVPQNTYEYKGYILGVQKDGTYKIKDYKHNEVGIAKNKKEAVEFIDKTISK